MLDVRLDYTIDTSHLERTRDNLKFKLGRMTDLMRAQVVPLVEAMLTKHWETKGAAFKHKWAPWAPATLLKRQRQGNVEAGLLRDRDNLFRSVFRAASAGSLRKVPNGAVLTLSTGVAYGVYHQVGTSYMPERQIFPYPFPESFKRDVRRAVMEYLRA